MNQFFADQVDQLDLAIDQLAMRDRNFDRFALMLIDNVVELVLHHHARDKLNFARDTDVSRQVTPEWKLAVAATGPKFDAKVRFAREKGMISQTLADSLLYLHTFRNSAYHQGSRQESILHSIAVFYLRAACSVLGAYRPVFYGIHSQDKISHRAVKYLGPPGLSNQKTAWSNAATRLGEVATALTENLVDDLQADMWAAIEQTDQTLDFISTEAPKHPSRDDIVRGCQAWLFAWTDEAKFFAKEKGYEVKDSKDFFEWLGLHFPWAVKTDPIDSWTERHASLKAEKDPHAALKKYCDFMKQTRSFRDALDKGGSQLEVHLQQEIDRWRGK